MRTAPLLFLAILSGGCRSAEAPLTTADNYDAEPKTYVDTGDTTLSEVTVEWASDIDDYPYDDYISAPSDYAMCTMLRDLDDLSDAEKELLLGGAMALTSKQAKLNGSIIGSQTDPLLTLDDACLLIHQYYTAPPAVEDTGVWAPPPTGNQPDELCPPHDDTPTNSVFVTSNSDAGFTTYLNNAQFDADQEIEGCWLRFEMNSSLKPARNPNLMWAAVLYGMKNYKTAAIMKYTTADNFDVIFTAYQVNATITGNVSQFHRFMANTTTVTSPGPITITINQVDFATLSLRSSNPADLTSSTQPWVIGSNAAAIIDPTSPDNVAELDAFMTWAEDNLTIEYNTPGVPSGDIFMP